ncbi:MAG: hypothetical protein ABIR24_07110 [Verrucomicrobiota bacterium]
MDFSRAKFYKPVLLAVAASLFFGVSQTQRALNHDRERLGLTRVTPLENAPPILAFTTVALGGFRGLISNALWIRANDLQENDKFFEAVQLADWITKLEPHVGQVWFFLGWNMAYNISVKFSDPADRWRWVQRGIELFRDQGLLWNPDETLLYRELSWIFQHKMGANLDDAHQFYKRAWANEMQKLFGGKPNFDELLNPQTEDAKNRVKLLREKYKMDPKIMKEADELYGPLEWRLPDAHAIYWAELGRRKGKQEEQQTLRRSIYQTMQQAFFRGGLTENKVDKTFILGPNLNLVEKLNKTYETMMDEDPTQKEHMKTGHKNFLINAVYLLYVDYREAEAKRWYDYLEKLYPKAVVHKSGKKLSLDEFAIALMTEDVGETDVNKTTAIIRGLLRRSFIDLALDEDDRALKSERLAQQIWNRYQKEIEGAGDRVGLKPMNDLKTVVRNEIFNPETGVSPDMAARIRTKLGLSSPTNAPPTEAIPK